MTLKSQISNLKFAMQPMLLSGFILAQSKQDEVLRSISENVSSSGDGSGKTFVAIILGIVGLIILVTIINARSKREAVPKSKRHPSKLLRDLAKQIQLRPVEVKQLKLLARGENDAGKTIDNPLVFLLCPSVFTDAVRAQRVKSDRKVMAALARKLGLITTAKPKR